MPRRKPDFDDPASDRIPPVPPRKPPPAQSDPSFGGIEPKFDPQAGLDFLVDGATEIGVVGGPFVPFLSKSLLRGLGAFGPVGLLVGFMLGAFGNNLPPGVGQDPNVGA